MREISITPSTGLSALIRSLRRRAPSDNLHQGCEQAIDRRIRDGGLGYRDANNDVHRWQVPSLSKRLSNHSLGSISIHGPPQETLADDQTQPRAIHVVAKGCQSQRALCGAHRRVPEHLVELFAVQKATMAPKAMANTVQA